MQNHEILAKTQQNTAFWKNHSICQKSRFPWFPWFSTVPDYNICSKQQLHEF